MRLFSMWDFYSTRWLYFTARDVYRELSEVTKSMIACQQKFHLSADFMISDDLTICRTCRATTTQKTLIANIATTENHRGALSSLLADARSDLSNASRIDQHLIEHALQ